jgi:hypothetical protein
MKSFAVRSDHLLRSLQLARSKPAMLLGIPACRQFPFERARAEGSILCVLFSLSSGCLSCDAKPSFSG